MRAWIRFTARLYPRAWRERYGAEFDALLEDANVRWSDLPDVLRTALEIHMKTWSFRRLAAAGGLAGAVFAAAIAFRMPDQYASRAVLGYTGAESALAGPVHQALTGPFLAELSRKLDLYPAEQQRMTGDEVAHKMRHGIVVMIDRSSKESGRLILQYVHPDPSQAQRTTQQLVQKLMEANLQVAPAGTVKLLDAPGMPLTPERPNRLRIILIGTGLGLLLAGFTAIATRRSHPARSNPVS